MILPPLRRRLLFGIVLAALVLSGGVIARRAVRDHDSRRITLRFSHWQLEPGVRDAFDALSHEYERLHPDVRVEQLLIPETIFREWTLTQLVGGTAPDLVQRGKGIGVGSTLRFFRPITAETNEPNPYNAGTSLEHTPWRNTFNDGMEGGYDAETFECYSATLFTGTVRIFYNADLMREITGSPEPPATFNELCTLCARVRAFARRTGRKLVPMAGSSLTGSVMLDALFQGQTQRLASELNPAVDFPVDVEEFSLDYLIHRWTLDYPALRAASELMRAAGQLMPPGFMQAGREQANFQFVQGRALMMTGFTVETAGVLRQAGFPVRAFRCPQPARDDPRFGAQLVDRISENGAATYGGFGLTRSSRHPAEALDFLRFLTCESSCRTYTRISQNLPVITTVAVPAAVRDFAPDRRGFPPGPSFTYAMLDTNSLLLRTLHLLFGPDGDPGIFLQHFGRGLDAALRSDLEHNTEYRIAGVHRAEPAIAATRHFLLRHPDDAALALKYQSQVGAQNELEARIYYTQLRLHQAETR